MPGFLSEGNVNFIIEALSLFFSVSSLPSGTVVPQAANVNKVRPKTMK